MTTTPETPITAAAEIMVGRKIGCLPVVEGDAVVGILSEPDIVSAVARGASQRFDEDRRRLPQMINYEQGTLVVDIVDARSNKVIWRGWAQDNVEGVIDNQDWMERQLDEAVTRMLERFPLAL